MDPVTVSVAVMDWLAGGLEDDPGEGVHASVGGREGVVAGQDRRRIGAW